LIDAFLSSSPTPTIGAPPTLTPGEPKALLLPPVVCVPPIPFGGTLDPVIDVVPDPVVDPKPLLEPESVPPAGEVDDPLLPKGEVDEPLLPNGEVDEPEPKDEPLLPKDDPPEEPNDDPEDPEEPKVDPEDDPEPPKGEEEEPPMPDEPVELVAPVGVMPPVCPTV
jgi:hypothetical protein